MEIGSEYDVTSQRRCHLVCLEEGKKASELIILVESLRMIGVFQNIVEKGILDRKKKSGIWGKLWRFETAWPIWGLQSSAAEGREYNR